MRTWMLVGIAALLLVAALLALIVALWALPLAAVSATAPELGIAETLKAANDVRLAYLQLVGGLVVIGTLLFTGRSYLLTREGQFTDRYTRAVAQLGDQSPAVRTGGIYGLARVAAQSARDTAAVVEVLSGFIRSNAEWTPAAEEAAATVDVYSLPFLVVHRPDVQAALTVLGQIGQPDDWDSVKLVGLDLRRSYLADVKFAGFDLYATHLEIAQLSNANLAGATLNGAALDGAYLFGTNLGKCSIEGTTWQGAQGDQATVWPTDNFDPKKAGIIVHGPESG